MFKSVTESRNKKKKKAQMIKNYAFSEAGALV